MAKVIEGYHKQTVDGVVIEETFVKYDDEKFDVKTVIGGRVERDQKTVLKSSAAPSLFSKD